MQYDFVVIGANGIQGKIASRDLLENGHSVLLCANDDYKMDRLSDYKKSELSLIDLRKIERVKRVIKNSGASVLVNCAIDDFNLAVTKLALDLGMNYVDLGSEDEMTKEQLKLHAEFKEKGILGISGIGSTPGINNIMLRYVKDRFDTIETVHLGFAWDSNMPVFVTPFSLDAIAYEFTEKAKVLENGRYVDKSPEEPTSIDHYYKTIGRQRTCYTKHIEHHTFQEYLKDKGVKDIVVFSSFPPHSYNTIRKLMELGFLDKEQIEVNGANVRPLDFTIEIQYRRATPRRKMSGLRYMERRMEHRGRRRWIAPRARSPGGRTQRAISIRASRHQSSPK
jgi:saccharopine dehydrogenase-like NADP-dependent oxidoreductase